MQPPGFKSRTGLQGQVVYKHWLRYGRAQKEEESLIQVAKKNSAKMYD